MRSRNGEYLERNREKHERRIAREEQEGKIRREEHVGRITMDEQEENKKRGAGGENKQVRSRNG